MKLIKVLVIFCITVLLLVPVIASCNFSTKIGYVGSNVGNQIEARYQLFNGVQEKKIDVNAGDTIVFSYTSVVEKGGLELEVRDPDRVLVTELDTETTDVTPVIADKSGGYRLVIRGNNTEGSFNVSWEIK